MKAVSVMRISNHPTHFSSCKYPQPCDTLHDAKIRDIITVTLSATVTVMTLSLLPSSKMKLSVFNSSYKITT